MRSLFKAYRHRFRFWQNNRRLTKESTHYKNKLSVKKITVPNDVVLRDIFQARFSHVTPKPSGSLRICAIYHHYNWENYSLRPALEKFGEVLHYDWGKTI